METAGTRGTAETVAAREWVIRAVDADSVLVDQLPDGGSTRLDRSLLPDDVSEGDRFRVIAQVDRRGRGDGGDASPATPPPDGGGGTDARHGEPAGDENGAAAGSGLPDAMHEALGNLT